MLWLTLRHCSLGRTRAAELERGRDTAGIAMTLTCPKPLHHIVIGVSDIDARIKWHSEIRGYRAFTGPVPLTLEQDSKGN